MSSETENEMMSYTISEHQTPPCLPASMLAKRVNWDVFLSFDCDDTNRTFISSICDALKSKDLRFLTKDKSLNNEGDTVLTQPSLDEVMEDSALAVVILSANYAGSPECLKELSSIYKLYNKDSKKWEKRVIPVFYKVTPSDIRKQGGEFGDRFKQFLADSRDDILSENEIVWRSALEDIGNISGYECSLESTQSEAKVVQSIVQQVWSEVKNTPEYVVKLDVGLDDRVDKVVKLLDVRQQNVPQQNVRFLNIHGSAGIGKTTLAKAVYNKLAAEFNKRCFISNVREKLMPKGGILSVQNELIKCLSKGSVQSEEDGRARIKAIVNQNQVLLVLDDVVEAEQLVDIGIVREWFEQKSRIIVTSRNRDALSKMAGSDELYEATKLDASESLELFSIHALGRRKPTPDFKDISKKIVSLTDGLPLALEVFGSSLVKKTLQEWEDAKNKLNVERPRILQQILQISYDGLRDQEKIVFLDISCLLFQYDMKKEDIVDILVGCGLEAELAIDYLVTRSLLKVTEESKLWMHDQIRDMGRQIVIDENSIDIGKRSRLWDSMDTMRLLRQQKVTESVRGIALKIKKPQDLTDETICRLHLQTTPSISKLNRYMAVKFKSLTSGQEPDEDDGFTLQTKWFEVMKHMKLLRMDYVNLQGDFVYMPSELRWLQWKGCPQKSFPTNIPKELRVLDLSNSNIEQLWSSHYSLWGFNKVVGKLEVLNLSYCPKLSTLPDMSGQKHLKKLNLERCVGLTQIHESIGNMTSLVHLNLRGCTSLIELPRSVMGLIGLKELTLSYCSNFCKLPKDVGSMKSLKQLFLDGTSISELPETMDNLTQLEVLNLNTCHQLKCLPECLGSLTSLKELSLGGTKLEELPSSIGSLTCLETLNLVHCSSLTVLPESVGTLKALTKLLLDSSSIKNLPSTTNSLSNLRVLSLGRCRSLHELPTLKGLVSIVELSLGHTSIEVLPDDICYLEKLEKLEMNYCSKLEKLPESMGQLANLAVLFVEGAAITQLPESIGNMKKLSWLKLNKCSGLKSLPNSIGKLSSLRILMMENTGITCLPDTFEKLNGLRILRMKKSINYLPTDKIDDLPEIKLPTNFGKLTNLEEFDAQACGIFGEINDNFANLSKVEILDLGYNSFHKLPSSLEGLNFLKKLVLRHCNKLKILPGLPSTLEELNAADCYALETICDLSNLKRLQELQLANCSEISDVPGLQCLKSLRRLFMGGCTASAKEARNRLSKQALKNLNTLSLPGNEIPSWFSQTTVNFMPHRNLAIKSVIVAVVVSVDKQQIGPIRANLPSIVDIQATIIRQERSVFSTALILMGIPCTTADQLYMSRYKDYHPLVSMLKEGDIIQVGMKKCEADDITQMGLTSEAYRGIELKRWGIHLVFENDDDYDIDEVSLSLPESEQSVSQRLAMFFNSMDQT